ncbi:MAG: hypothetical protein FD153_1544 [Rhodospirillaceae bacterium]|nr:MAG: hypothetical protein FD153_1544 [Rhodospirillaceae bacterium]
MMPLGCQRGFRCGGLHRYLFDTPASSKPHPVRQCRAALSIIRGDKGVIGRQFPPGAVGLYRQPVLTRDVSLQDLELFTTF